MAVAAAAVAAAEEEAEEAKAAGAAETATAAAATAAAAAAPAAPAPAISRPEMDRCDHPLARALLSHTWGAACEMLEFEHSPTVPLDADGNSCAEICPR